MVITKRQVELEAIFLLTAVAAISLFFVLKNNNYRMQFNLASVPVMPVQAEVVSPKVIISSQISPDGKKKVMMKITENSDKTKTYDISTADENGANVQFVFTKTLDETRNMVLPFNTWSPDDKYFFVQENDGSNKDVFAFKATGEPFSESDKYFDVTDLFAKRNTGNNFDVATGWASETLIIVNTLKPDNSKGPSYWFEIPSKAVIQLSTEF